MIIFLIPDYHAQKPTSKQLRFPIFWGKVTANFYDPNETLVNITETMSKLIESRKSPDNINYSVFCLGETD